MAHVIIQREAVGRPGLPAPSRYSTVYLCRIEDCTWWGSRPAPHEHPEGKGRHLADTTFETSCYVVSRVFARYGETPVYSPSRNRRRWP